MVERRQRQASRARAYGLLALALVSDAGWIARASAQAPANAAPFQNAAPYQTAYNDLGLSAPFTGSAPAPTRPAFRMSAVDWRPKAAPIERTPSTAPAPAVRIDGEPIPAGSASAPTAAAARTSSSGPIAAAPPAAAGLPLGAGVAAGAATAGVVPVAGHAPNAGPTPNGNAAPTPAPAPSYAGSPNAPAAPVPPREGRTIITSEGRIPASAAPTAAAPNGPTPADPSGLPPRMASLPANSAPSDYPAPASANAPGSIAPASYEPSGEQPGVVRRIGNPTPADPNFSGWNAAQPAPTYDVARRQDGPAPPADAPAGGPSDAPLITGGEGIVPPPAPMSTDDDKGYWHLGQQHLDPRCKNPNLLAP
ncbi:MAG TPA: hypothetical protein VGE52_06080, partial [Pirellulales bacterium]